MSVFEERSKDLLERGAQLSLEFIWAADSLWKIPFHSFTRQSNAVWMLRKEHELVEGGKSSA